MRKKRERVSIILTMLLVSSLSIYSFVGYYTHTTDNTQNEYKITPTNKQNIAPKLTPFIDPLLKAQKKMHQKMLILFRDSASLDNIYPAFEKNSNIEILVRFKIIPAIFVDANLDDILDIASKAKTIIGIYANRKCSLADAFPSPISLIDDSSSRAIPTTNDTAQLIGADTFWKNNYSGDGIVVCVTDTGIDSNHPELNGKVIAAKSFVLRKYGYDRDNTKTEDEEGHGTACAGIIAGKGLDPRGQGMAPGALLMNARIFAPGSGGATWAGIIAAIEWATYGPDGVPNTGDEADIISMSIGGGQIYNSPMWLAIKRATEYGIIVSISAGNEGDNQLYSMSTGDPGNSPWSITSGATNPYYTGLDDYYGQYTSFGPTIALAVKPDVVSPSGTIVLDYDTDGYTSEAWHGTSFSCPHTSGALALILDYLRDHNVAKKYYPWIAKTILMKTADTLYESTATEILKYEDMIIGAGAINLNNVFNTLESAIINGDNYPQWLMILPKEIPVGVSNSTEEIPEHEDYFPYFDRIFNDQTIFFNFTIIASRNTTLSVSFSSELLNVLDIHSNTTIKIDMSTTYWLFNFTVKTDAPEGIYSGLITFTDDYYGQSIEVLMTFKIVRPVARILYDLRHTDWSTDFRYGQYRFLTRAFEKLHNASVDMWHHFKGELTFDALSKYDIIFMPDTASIEWNIAENGTILGNFTNRFTHDEIDAIYKYISHGGVIIAFALDADYHNLTSFNELISIAYSQLTATQVPSSGATVAADTVGDHAIVRGISNLSYMGLAMSPSPLVDAFLKYEDFFGKEYRLAIVFQNLTGGGIIALGTNFMFDNWAFKGQYPGSGYMGANSYRFVSNILEFAKTDKDYIRWVHINLTTRSCFPMTKIKVKLNASPDIDFVEWIYTTGTNEYVGNLTFNITSGLWEVIIQLNTTGMAYLKFKGYLNTSGDAFYVVRSTAIYVDDDAPTISILSPLDGYFSTLDQDLEIIIGIEDLGGLNYTAFSFGINSSAYTNRTIIYSETYMELRILMEFEYLREIAIITNPFYFDISISVSDILGHLQSTDCIITVSLSDLDPPIVEYLNYTYLIAYPEQSLNIAFSIFDANTLTISDAVLNLSEYSIDIQEISYNKRTIYISISYTTLLQYIEMNKHRIVIAVNITAEDIALNNIKKTYNITILIKSETNPPEILLMDISNNSNINISTNQNLSISIIVQDDSQIKNVSVQLNLSENEYTLEIEKVNGTYWRINIKIPWTTIQSYTENNEPITITIHVSSYDINENSNQKIFAVSIIPQISTTTKTTTTQPQGIPTVSTLILIATVAIAAITSTLLFLKKRRKS